MESSPLGGLGGPPPTRTRQILDANAVRDRSGRRGGQQGDGQSAFEEAFEEARERRQAERAEREAEAEAPITRRLQEIGRTTRRQNRQGDAASGNGEAESTAGGSIDVLA